MIRVIFCIFLTFLLATAAKATHIVGGELTYRCLGNNQYEIKLSVYRDCYNGVPPFDDPAAIGIFSDAYETTPLFDLRLNVTAIDDTLDIYLDNPCLTVPPDVCVHRTTYTDTVTLMPRPGGYNVVYQRCCRNKLIRNIPLPEDVGITIIAEINDLALETCNQGAYYNNWPPLAICVNEPINFDHSATDNDGDSLVYRLCAPLSGANDVMPIPQPPNPGPYIEVTWQAPYSLNDLLGGTPLAIDPNNGFITGVPNTVGNYVVGVCVDEYRGNTLISTTRRDFQYNVADCGQSQAAFFAPELLCEERQVTFDNQSEEHPLATTLWYFDWTGDLSLQSTDYEPVFTYPDTGRYTVALILNNEYVCRDTFYQEIWVTEANINVAVITDYDLCDTSGVLVRLANNSTDPQHGIAGYSWQISGPGNFTYITKSEDPEFRVQASGTYLAILTVTGNNGCTKQQTIPFTVPIPPVENFVAQYVVCPGDEVSLFPGADPAFEYVWSPAAAFPDNTVPNPTLTPIENGMYTVTISDPNGICTRTRTVNIVVLAPGTLSVSATPPVIYQGESTQLLASFPNALEFLWTPAGSLNNPNIANPLASPTDSTLYTVTIKTTGECGPSASVFVRVLSPVCDEPFMFFPTAFSPNGDGENEVLKMEGRLATEVYWVIYNRWGQLMFEAKDINDFWDGTYKGAEQPAETYGYYFRIRCFDGQVREKKGNVTLIR